VQRHELVVKSHTAEVFTTELTRLQREILCLLAMPKAYSG